MTQISQAPYIIAFTQGSSGRFAKYLLYNLLTDASVELDPCPITNSTHSNDKEVYTGYRHIREDSELIAGGVNNPNIFKIFKFDDPLEDPDAPKILCGHVFPDFKLIKDRFGPDAKIIIITINPHDIKEVVVNDKVKNYYDILTGNSRHLHNPNVVHELLKRYERFLGKKYPGTYVKSDIIQIAKSVATENLGHFVNRLLGNPTKDTDCDYRIGQYLILPKDIDYPADQILFLPYSEIANYTDDGYVWLNKLEEFTGKKANAVTIESYQKYIDGRWKLLKEYRF
jgi:hypothetical protein